MPAQPAEEPELRDGGNQLHGEGAVLPDVLLDSRQELRGDPVPYRGARENLFLREQLVDAKEVDVLEVSHRSILGGRAAKRSTPGPLLD
jgi:hypothetical protein